MRSPILMLSASRQNLLRLVWLRLLVWLAQVGSVGFIWWQGELALPYVGIAVCLCAAGALVFMTLLRLRVNLPVTDFEYSVHLTLDIVLFTALLYFSGGATNPFVSYYLVPLAIAATTVPWRHSLLLSGLALSGYSLLLLFYHPIHAQTVAARELLVSTHLFGMWLSLAMAAGLLTLFVAPMAATLRRQLREQAERRELSLRDEQLLAVATQAAGAAHELGTPLSTMSVLLKELRSDYPADSALQEDLALLQAQVSQCKTSLQTLVRSAERERAQQTPELDAHTWLTQVLERFSLMRPEASWRVEVQTGDVPRLMVPADLSQALLNLLNNAADACADGLRIAITWNAREVCVQIRDQGAGLPMGMAEQWGTPFLTTKGGGLGLGLFLSQASVNRAGGRVTLYNHEQGGTVSELVLPRQGVNHG
ncbi:ATP-binding protein [Atopomonas sediminilitoris]|uniref:ATP-binding protein n=1 Tax=Atopomonas sediminilitoris TaxID=2919919 RepID=UPI001F4D6F37|nr:ATP-binding protein [Atopomonas sediminilitoris]MCJ8169676.1 ATP-binding protein [Atopomonas sediminilitoris]